MRFLPLALMLSIGAAATPAAASRALHVRLNDCPRWSGSEVERLARLELATVGGGESNVGAATVEITCDDAGAALRASESRAGRALARRIELLEGAEDAERVLAISAAQLVRALDWLPEPRAAPAEVKRLVAPQPPPGKRRALELQLSGGGRARDPGAPFFTYRVSFGSGLQLGPGMAVGGVFNYERGDATRALGRVRTELLGAALQASLDPWRGNHWSCLWRAELGVSRISLRGQDGAMGVNANQIRGVGGEAQLAVGPVLRSAGIGVALLAQGGGSYFGGEGLISRGDAVNLNGAWAGLELAAMWAP